MTNDITEQSGEESFDELTMLKERAKKLGISFSNNIGLQTLKEKIREKLQPDEPIKDMNEVQARAARRKKAREELLKLRRIRIANLNPANKDVPGQVFRFRNTTVGSVGKYVPFNGEDAEAWHVPQCIYNMLKEKKYLSIREVKNPTTGRTKMVTELVPEFSIIDLPPLTREELEKMAVEQAAAGLTS